MVCEGSSIRYRDRPAVPPSHGLAMPGFTMGLCGASSLLGSHNKGACDRGRSGGGGGAGPVVVCALGR